MQKFNPDASSRYQYFESTIPSRAVSRKNSSISLSSNVSRKYSSTSLSGAPLAKSPSIYRKRSNNLKLKNYGKLTEVKLTRRAMEENQMVVMQVKHCQQCCREKEALKRRGNAIAQKKQKAQECYQRSNSIKILKANMDQEWPNTYPYNEL